MDWKSIEMDGWCYQQSLSPNGHCEQKPNYRDPFHPKTTVVITLTFTGQTN